MRLMGIEALYSKPKTTIRRIGHKVFPYLLKNLAVVRPNQVWCADITYIPTAVGYMYLVAIIDWHSRYVLAWRLSNTMEATFCIDALEEALALGCPEIFNTDQGSQFTCAAFIGVLEAKGITISMDGRGRCYDNIFIERLWRSVKYEEVYLKDYANADDAETGIAAYMVFYNDERPHQALDYMTPYEVHHACGTRVPA